MSVAPELMLWTLVLVRSGGLIAALPVLSTNNVPRTIRLALGVFLAVLTAPLLPTQKFGELDLWQLVQLVDRKSVV